MLKVFTVTLWQEKIRKSHFHSTKQWCWWEGFHSLATGLGKNYKKEKTWFILIYAELFFFFFLDKSFRKCLLFIFLLGNLPIFSHLNGLFSITMSTGETTSQQHPRTRRKKTDATKANAGMQHSAEWLVLQVVFQVTYDAATLLETRTSEAVLIRCFANPIDAAPHILAAFFRLRDQVWMHDLSHLKLN